MKSNNQMTELSLKEIESISGGHSKEDGFWYQVGKFFAEQANASDSIYKTYGNTNRNHIF